MTLQDPDTSRTVAKRSTPQSQGFRLSFGGSRVTDNLTDSKLFSGVLPRRAVAYVIDLAIVGFISGSIFVVGLFIGLMTLGLAWPLVGMAIALVGLAYPVLTIGGPWSATVGMRLMGIEIRSITGERPPYLQAAVMMAVYFMSVPPTAGLALIVTLLNERNRTLHDILSGVVAVDAKALESR
ncbi:MAG: RDD family protein [Pseudomonadota bacterium]